LTLVLRGYVPLPAHAAGGFDHGDVHVQSGRVFVAHTANGTIDVLDGERLACDGTLVDCPEASGVLCVQKDGGLVFAAARGAGVVRVFDPVSYQLLTTLPVGPRPNGLAWDAIHTQLLVADVQEQDARLVDPRTGACLARARLPGRPRWCVYDARRERFLVNVREPACLVALAAETLDAVARIDGLAAGPHGLDLDVAGDRAFVACDAGVVIVLDLSSGHEVARVLIDGEPDAIWYSSARDRLYVAVGQPGVVDVLDCRGLTLAERITTEEGAHTTAFDQRRQRLYAFLPRSCRAAVYEDTESAHEPAA